MPEPTGDLTTDVAKAAVSFPRSLIEWVGGMLYAIFTDSAIQTFIVTGVLAGLVADSILVGGLVFFILHSVATMLRLSLSGAASLVGNNVASVMIQRMQREDLAMAQRTQSACEDEQSSS